MKKGTTTWLVMSRSTYTEEALRKICALLKVVTLRKDKLTSSPGDHPELYSSPLMSEGKHHFYQHLVGMAEWMVQIGRFEIRFTVTSLNRFSAAPKEGHIKPLVKIFGYLQKNTRRWKSIFILPEDIREVRGKGDNT